MAAAPAMTAALRGARAERASWRADGRTAHIPAGGGQGARAPTLTPAAPRSTGRGRRLPGSCPPKPRLPENTAPLLAVSLRAGGREGREGREGVRDGSKLKTASSHLPSPCRGRSCQTPPWRAQLRLPRREAAPLCASFTLLPLFHLAQLQSPPGTELAWSAFCSADPSHLGNTAGP